MSARKAAQQQYRRIMDQVIQPMSGVAIPPEGWLCTVRKALGMSGAQLARRLGVTRARVSQAESAERSGSATLKSMQSAAEALGCRFVYAIVPPGRIEDVIAAQARRKASTLVATANRHMALESQTLSAERIEAEIERTARDMIHEMPAGFWDDK